MADLSSAHVVLLAAHLCATADIAALPSLQALFPAALPLERLLRVVLTFLPESTEPRTYVPVLEQLVAGSSTQKPAAVQLDTSPVETLSAAEARRRVRKLRLRRLLSYGDDDSGGEASGNGNIILLGRFLIQRAYLIDSETALQPLILELLAPFCQRSETVRTFLVSRLLPLLRLNYEYYPNNADDSFSLDLLDSMETQTAVNIFLSMTGPLRDTMDLVRNLRGLVGPWLYGDRQTKRRKLDPSILSDTAVSEGRELDTAARGWDYVNEWLLARSLVDRHAVARAFTTWRGPDDVDLGGHADVEEDDQQTRLRTRYAQAALAAVLASPDAGRRALDDLAGIVGCVTRLLQLEDHVCATDDTSALPSLRLDLQTVSTASKAVLLQNALLQPSNPLTLPSAASLAFLSAILLSLRVLDELGHPATCRTAVDFCLHSSEDMQLLELRNIVDTMAKQSRSNLGWEKVRRHLLWLCDWHGEDPRQHSEPRPAHHGLFWRVPGDTVEKEILKSMLAAKEYQSAIEIYVKNANAPLSAAQVEEAVIEAIFTAYDNASNGNRTRGGMKKAFEILQAFQPRFPASVALQEIQALIVATHALSFYSLTLQHGVPFKPVNIRVHPDPLALIEKVLAQNAHSYTKLDDLLSIGRNLVAAGLPTATSLPHPSRDTDLVVAERRIISLAISAALSSGDFGTAYSYVTTRLTPPSLVSPAVAVTTPPAAAAAAAAAAIQDDISWRAAYNAGRHRSISSAPQSSSSPSVSPSSPSAATSTTLAAQIAALSQRMELLSIALLLVPPTDPAPLPEILGTWRRCDEELATLRARESHEANLWDAKGDALFHVPGSFAGRAASAGARRAGPPARPARASEHSAPMGLFEVARGAALALRSNALALGPGASTSAAASASASASPSASAAADASTRVRKRDVVSNMVTGGLASGIGWVLGAQPAER